LAIQEPVSSVWPFLIGGSVAFTQANITDIEAALVEIAIRGVAELEINGRRVKYSDPAKLQKLLVLMQGQVNSDTYGACMPVIFEGVDG